MSEEPSALKKEWIVKSTEQWVGLSDKFKPQVEKVLTDAGMYHPSLELVDQGLYFDSSDDIRYKRVVKILNLSNTQTTQTLRTQVSNNSFGIHELVVGNNNRLITLSKGKEQSSEDFLKILNATIRTANETLDLFGEPAIPSYTSQTTKLF